MKILQVVVVLVLTGGTAMAASVLQAMHGVYQTVYQPGLNEIVVRRTPAAKIALNPQTQHSWIIEVEPAASPRSIREVYTLPGPAHWGQVEMKNVSEDRTRCVNHGILAPGQKYMFNTWGMNAEDPTGGYKIDVYIDDALVKTFQFEVVKKSI